jgi:hypothetical protein
MSTTVTHKEAIHSQTVSTSGAMLHPSPVASSQKTTAPRKVPMFIPEDQVYFWSSRWQADEAETLASLRAGRGKTFSDPLDAVRYLLNDCDD